MLSSDSKTMTLHKLSSLHTSFFQNFWQKETELVLYWITSRFGSALQVLPSDIGEYFGPFFFNVVVVFIYIIILSLKNVFFNIVNSCVRNNVYLIIYLLKVRREFKWVKLIKLLPWKHGRGNTGCFWDC